MRLRPRYRTYGATWFPTWLCLIWGVVWLSCSASGWAQANKKQKDDPKRRPKSNAIQFRRTEVKAYRLGSVGGISQYVQGRWNDVAVEVENPTDKDVVMLATTNLEGVATQYGRRLWVPAHARRVSSYPILFEGKTVQTRFQLESRLIPDAGGGIVKSQESMLHRTRLPAVKGRFVSAVFLEPFVDLPNRALRGLSEEAPEDIGFTALEKMRLTVGLAPRISQVGDDPLPATAAAFSCVDNLTITGNRILDHPATLAAVRRWLMEGGRIWLLLDRVDMRLAHALVGEGFGCHPIDYAELTEFRVVSGDGNETGELRSYDYPVRHRRMLIENDDIEVTHVVNGWPACFLANVGRGSVMFTTLEPRGWMEEFNSPVTGMTDYSASPELGDIGQQLLIPRNPPMIDANNFKSYLNEQIGYKIVGRGWVIVVLSCFAIGLIVAGILLQRKGKLEWIMAIGPALGLVATVTLLSLGFSSKQAVQPTLALEQWVEAEPQANTLRVEGLLGVYNQTPSEAQIGTSNGRFELDLTADEGETRRMIYTDYNRWRWENLRIDGGTVRTAPFVNFMSLEKPVEAVARLGPQGLEGELRLGPFKQPADAILASAANGKLSLNLSDQGFTASAEDILAPDQFLSSNLLTDAQRRRQRLLRSMLSRAEGRRYPLRPTVLVWTQPVAAPFNFPDQSENIVGEALLSLPLRLIRSRAGKVTIPGTLIPYRSVPGPGRSQANSIYNHRTGEWTTDVETSSRVWLAFRLPKQVLPLKVTAAKLNLLIDAPDRNLVITAIRDGKSVDVAEKLSPAGRVKFEVEDVSLVQPAEDGTIMLGFEMSTSRKLGSGSVWTIEQLQLEVAGEISEDAGLEESGNTNE